MKFTLARVLLSSCALLLAASSTACVDEARCDAALAGVAREHALAARRGALLDAQIAWLRGWQASMAGQLQAVAAGAGNGNDALRNKLAALEAENAALTQRLARAERRLDEGREASPPIEAAQAGPATPGARRLDESVPYDLTGFLAKPRPSGKREASGATSGARPSRRLDEVTPYSLGPREPGQPGQRTLDETVPY